MKKVVVAILAIVYITTSTVVTVNMHYCRGEMVNWSIGQNNSKICGKCGMIENDIGCCKVEYKYAKIDSDQKPANEKLHLTKLPAFSFPDSYIEFRPDDIPANTQAYPIIYQPPRSSGVAINVRNCFFLI